MGHDNDYMYQLVSRWVGRNRQRDLAALAMIENLEPATVVTGASEGLGFALARVLAREGRTVVLVARNKLQLDTVVNTLASECPAARVFGLSLDVGSTSALADIDMFVGKHGLYLDVLVNNAGMGAGGPFSTMDTSKLEECCRRM